MTTNVLTGRSTVSSTVRLTDQLTDRFNRRLNYLRVSVTDRCNLSCTYCVPRSPVPRLSHGKILRYEEILRIVTIGAKMGISKIRVTGGEPLVRKGICEFLNALSDIDGIDDISLTTNALLLKDKMPQIIRAGIRRINISLDTLEPEKYRQITGRDAFNQVWEGIMASLDAGFSPVKLNAVVLKGVNEDELGSLAALSFKYPLHIRFIEYMPIGISDAADQDAYLSADDVLRKLGREIGPLYPVKNTRSDGPAVRYRFEGALGEVGLIRPLSHHFCDHCNRLRLTAAGGIRPCLLSDYQEDIKSPLRAGCHDRQLADILLKAVRFKPRGHLLNKTTFSNVASQMSGIGG